MMPRDPDPIEPDFLDAFGPTDLDDPDLARLDEAVDRLAHTPPAAHTPPSTPPPANRRPTPALAALAGVVAGVIVGAAAAAGAFSLWPSPLLPDPPQPPTTTATSPPKDQPTAPPPKTRSTHAPPAPPALPEPSTDALPASPLAPLAAPAPHISTAPPSPKTLHQPPAHPPQPPAAPPKRALPGLVPDGSAVVTIARDRAVLHRGLLTYIHDADHEPGVHRVGLDDLPVLLEPVGTRFAAHAARFVGALRVTEGTVRVVHRDGTLLAHLSPGQEVVTVSDLDARLGVRLINTTDLPLDVLPAQLPPDCLCHPKDVIASIAAVRLAARP